MAPEACDIGPGAVFGTVRGALWRLALTVLLPLLWLTTLLLFYAFWATGFTWGQDLVLGIVSGLGVLAALTAVWFLFGLRVAGRWVDF